MVLGDVCTIKGISFKIDDLLIVEEIKNNSSDALFDIRQVLTLYLTREGYAHEVRILFEHEKGAETAHKTLVEFWRKRCTSAT